MKYCTIVIHVANEQTQQEIPTTFIDRVETLIQTAFAELFDEGIIDMATSHDYRKDVL
jgi:hypothetical protein